MSEQDGGNLAELDSQSSALSELTKETKTPPILKGLGNLSMARQIGLMLGIALSVAVGIAVVLWSQAESRDLLFSGIGTEDATAILETLDKMGVDYSVETETGAIMVPTDQVRALKLKLAAQGLPRTQSSGYEILDKESGFGTSKNIELMRFQRALEGEIAKTIASIQNIKSARVLLALPKQSVFVRKRKKPSASVIVNLYQGRSLEKGQIESIVHLVASSVPMMESTQVTVVDQKGRMLSSNDSSEEMYLTSKQFEYKKNIEEHLMQRIENILLPLVGREGMQAQISADVDFTVTEKTQEMFNPDLPALRSEQTQDERNSGAGIQGVPGALSNQPPPAGVAPEIAVGKDGQTTASSVGSVSKSATRNYELDKTITHTRLATGVLRRLSVAVVVDDKKILSEDGSANSQPYAQEDVNQLRELVMQAVGFDSSRGDLVTVTNVAFRIPDELEALPEIPLWEQPWFIGMAKQLMAVLVVIFLVFGVLRPTMRGLIARDEEVKALIDAHAEADATGGIVRFDKDGKPMAVAVKDEESEAGEGGVSAGVEDILLLEAPQSYEKRLEYVQRLIDEDPKVVAQLIREWVRADG
ncbi:MAG: flagellar basal body M-ring protein FliF [Methylomarinum sp.]|nr:flagellar basal body M-ring protein FliF [Methylomarinum sp.]